MSHQVLALLPLFALSLPGQQPSSPHLPRFAATVDAIAAEHLQAPGAVGLSIGVLWRGEMLGKGYGLADAEFGVAADAATMFRIGSITKQFTAALVLRLVEQGKIALDDACSEHVPEFDTGSRVVTVHQLLNHTSGILNYTELGEPWQRLWPVELTHAQVLDLVRDRPFDFEPGQGWHYSNTGYYLLGMLLENATGQSYAEQVRALAAELGLERTRYDSNRELIRNRAQGYDYVGGQLHNDLVLGMSQPGGAGGLISTGADLVRWAEALAGGKVVRAESYARMCRSEPLPNGEDPGYGYGMRRGAVGGAASLGHGGGIFGFNSELFSVPEHDFHVAVISNGATKAHRVASAIAYAVLGLDDEGTVDLEVPVELRAALTGEFDFAAIGRGLKVFEQGGRLFARGTGQSEFRLLYRGDHEFRADFDPSVRLMFSDGGKALELHQNGRIVHGVRK